MTLVASIIIALIAGAIVFFIGTLFDKTPNNRYAGIAGLIVFVLVFLSSYGRIDF